MVKYDCHCERSEAIPLFHHLGMAETQSKNISDLLNEIFIFSATFKAEILARSAELDDGARARLAVILAEAVAFQKEEIKERQAEDPDFSQKVKQAVATDRRKIIAARSVRNAVIDKEKVRSIIDRIKKIHPVK
jgi:hypothetical protein